MTAASPVPPAAPHGGRSAATVPGPAMPGPAMPSPAMPGAATPGAAVPEATAPDAVTPRAATGRILVVASGKGGVGKTWLAITLAQALTRAGGRRVLLVDGDLGLANVDVQLGLDPPHDLSAVLAGRVGLAAAALRHAGGGGFDILPGRSGSGRLAALDQAALDRVLALLHEATGRWEAVVVDLGAGLGAAQRRIAAAADTLLVVATDEPTSLTDAYAVLKLHHRDRPGGDARIVVNQAADAAAGARTYACRRRRGTRAAGVSAGRPGPGRGVRPAAPPPRSPPPARRRASARPGRTA